MGLGPGEVLKNVKLAFTFPGQGSQSIGMLSDLATTHRTVQDTFAEASDVLGYDLWQLCQEGPEERLNATEQTQPAMLAAGVATWRVWTQCDGARPDIAAGHSLGEYSALVCADSLDYGDAVRLVAARARFMQEAVPAGQGAIAAVLGLDDEQIRDVCERAAQGEVVEPVNYNAPGQVVVAGHSAAVDRALELARETGARRCVRIAMSVPSHCTLMKPAAERLMELLDATEFRKPRIPVVHNVDVTEHPEPEAIRDALCRQVYSPVRWVETVRRLAADGVSLALEPGPGRVLAGLGKRIVRELPMLAIHDNASLEAALAASREHA